MFDYAGSGITLHRTRFNEKGGILGFTRVCPNVWMVVNIEDDAPTCGSTVGEQYRTKAELLANLTAYARENWGY